VEAHVKLRFRVPVALIAILAAGFALRIWSIGWGMPYTYHGDEPKYLARAVNMLVNGDLNPHYFENPPLLTYAILIELQIILHAGQLLGFLHSATDIGTQQAVDPTPLYIMVRTQVALLGTGTVLLTYLIARRLLDVKSALLGALVLAVSFLHVRDSHYAVNDIPATFLLMTSVYFASRVFTDGRRRDYVLGGIFLGLAVATKYNVGLGAVALLAAHLLSRKNHPRLLDIRAHLPLLAAAAASLLAYVLANPYSVLDSAAFLKDFSSQYHWTADPFSTSDTSMAEMILRVLSVGIGPAILVASVLGLGVMVFRRRREMALLASFPLVYLAFFLMGSSLFYARFAIPMLPFIALFAGYAVVYAAHAARVVVPRWGVAIIAVAIIALMVAPSVVLDVRHDSLLRAEDTRLLLGRWVEQNIPPGSKIGLEGYTFLDSEGKQTGPKGIQYSLRVVPSLRVSPPDFYVQEKYDYLIVSSFVYDRYLLSPETKVSAIQAYQEFDRRFQLVASFSPTSDGHALPFLMDEEITPIYTVLDRDRPGPTLKVYRVSSPVQYGVEWLNATVPTQLSPGQQMTVPITVRNTGDLVWPVEGLTPVRVGYRWIDPAGKEVTVSEQHSRFPQQVEPGSQAISQLQVIAPAVPGEYTLRLDLVQENFSWLSAKGAQTKDVTVSVR
jgi:4-amino-4-deoxy-L-arabinose transferase-like glycosyltransferase